MVGISFPFKRYLKTIKHKRDNTIHARIYGLNIKRITMDITKKNILLINTSLIKITLTNKLIPKNRKGSFNKLEVQNITLGTRTRTQKKTAFVWEEYFRKEI
jgi:hypothetical protein